MRLHYVRRIKELFSLAYNFSRSQELKSEKNKSCHVHSEKIVVMLWSSFSELAQQSFHTI